jgi:hypothetical protein
MKTLRGPQLNAADRNYVLAAFIYRQTHENKAAHPDAVLLCGSRLPLISDARWLEITDFSVTRAGRLDRRASHCMTHDCEVPERKAMIDAWASQRAN